MDRNCSSRTNDRGDSTGSATPRPQHWLGVVSRAHVERGRAGGFAQLCHGKAAPLRRMNVGDHLIYYSPTTEFRGGEKLQAFTALGRVVDDRVYEHEMADGWRAFRRDVIYEAARPIPLAALAGRLHLTAAPHWGVALRRGHLPLDDHDFELIARAMRG